MPNFFCSVSGYQRTKNKVLFKQLENVFLGLHGVENVLAIEHVLEVFGSVENNFLGFKLEGLYEHLPEQHLLELGRLAFELT